MLGFALRRLARAALTVLVAFACVFCAIRATPGGPAQAMLGQRATAAEIERLNRAFGWDRPVAVQMGRYLGGVVRGDLGVAYMSPGRPAVVDDLKRRFPATVELAVAALLLAVGVGVPVGIAAAAMRGRWLDRLVIALGSVGVSIPVFFLGILLLLAFTSLPGGQRLDTRMSMAGLERTGLYLLDAAVIPRWDLLANAAEHLLLPAITLASIPMAIVARVSRSAMLEVMGAEFVRTARAKGLARRVVLLRHALPAAAVPILSLLGMQFATLLAGAILTETVFQWPGMGSYIKDAALNKDYNALQGAVLLLGIVFIVVNFLTDMLCAACDPRIRLGAQRP